MFYQVHLLDRTNNDEKIKFRGTYQEAVELRENFEKAKENAFTKIEKFEIPRAKSDIIKMFESMVQLGVEVTKNKCACASSDVLRFPTIEIIEGEDGDVEVKYKTPEEGPFDDCSSQGLDLSKAKWPGPEELHTGNWPKSEEKSEEG